MLGQSHLLAESGSNQPVFIFVKGNHNLIQLAYENEADYILDREKVKNPGTTDCMVKPLIIIFLV